MKLIDEQQRLLLVMRKYEGKAPMTSINGLFHKNTINALKKLGLLEVPLMGGWYLLTKAGQRIEI